MKTVKKRKQRSDKGKKRTPYKKPPPQEPTPDKEPTPPQEPTPDKDQNIDNLFNTDEVFKEFTAYEPPEKRESGTTKKRNNDAKKIEYEEPNFLEQEDESDGDWEETRSGTEKDWVKFAIRTIKKFDVVRALGLSFYSGESSKKYLEYQNINSSDDLVQDTAEVMQKHYIEMKPEYAIATTLLMSTFLLFLDAKEHKAKNYDKNR